MGRCYIPSGGPDAWKHLLARPHMHWKPGRSAMTLAQSWEAQDRLPEEIAALIRTVPQYRDQEAELLMAMPEWPVPLPGGSTGSQSDVLALIGVGKDLMVVAVEGKVAETFGATIKNWRAEPSKGKAERLRYMCSLLGMKFPPEGHLRYQLFHRAASAVIECRRFRGRTPAMIVHSFSQERKWFEDFAAFAEALGGTPEPDRMTEVPVSEGASLLLGWACGNLGKSTA